MQQSLAPAAARKSTLIGDTGRRLLLIMNPYSGMKIGKRHLADILEKFCRAGYVPTTFMTTGRGNATDLAARYGAQADLIVCLGGDGTFNEVVSGMLKADVRTPIGYIPCGSTNDFAASIGLSRGLTAAADDILAGTPHTYDIGRFDQRYFSYVASFGAFTKTTYTVQQDIKNMFGHFAYLLEGVKNLDTLCPYRMKITADGEVFDGEYLFGAISNSTSIAGLMKLSPDEVSFDDGKFELLLVPVPRTPAAMQALILALINKDYYDSEGLIFRHVRHVTAETAEDIPWTLDGEYDPGAPVVEIEIEENGVTMLL